MNRNRALALAAGLVATALAAAAAPVAAQTKAGTASAEFLLIEPDARLAAMGNAGVSMDGGVQSAYFNPAAIGLVDRYEARFTHALWLADISYDYVAAGIPLGHWGAALASVTALNSGDIAVRTVTQPFGTGELYNVSDVAIGLGYGLSVTDRVCAGVQASLVQETIYHSSASTVTLSFGTLYRLSPNGLRLGASLSNFGAGQHFSGRDLRITYDSDPLRYGDNGSLPGERFTGTYPLPLQFRVGMGMPWRLNSVTRVIVSGEASHPSDNTESVSMGAEVEYRKFLALRLGYQDLGLQDSEVGLTLGGGVQGQMNGFRYHVDYAWADQGRFAGTHRFTLGVTL